MPAFATLIVCSRFLSTRTVADCLEVVMNLPGVVYRSDNYYCAIWFRPLYVRCARRWFNYLFNIQDSHKCRHSGHSPLYGGISAMYVLIKSTSTFIIQRLAHIGLYRPCWILALQKSPYPKASNCPRLCPAPSLHPPFTFLGRKCGRCRVRVLCQAFRANILIHHP